MNTITDQIKHLPKYKQFSKVHKCEPSKIKYSNQGGLFWYDIELIFDHNFCEITERFGSYLNDK